MASYSLYEGSPLFGDLMGLTPDVNTGVYGGQDGAPGKSVSSPLIQGHEESSSPSNGLLEPLDFGWMDSNVDLLQFLTGEEVAPLEPINPTVVKTVGSESVKSTITEADSAIAVEILKSVVEDTTKMLDSGSDPAINESSDSSQDRVMMDWLDVLDEEVSQALSDYVVAEDSGPVLSPVTAEDVESVLSSGSSSPAQEIENTADVFSIVQIESMDTLDIDHLDHLDTSSEISMDSSSVDSSSSVFSDVHAIQSDLETLLAQVKVIPDDHTYQSPVLPEPAEDPSISSSRSRPKPYSRKNNSRSSAKPPKEPKVADRHERKKQQNKDAALRYRLKKKQEADVISYEVSALEDRNTQLKDTVEQMTREIKYLKDLLSDVYKAKGIVKSK